MTLFSRERQLCGRSVLKFHLAIYRLVKGQALRQFRVLELAQSCAQYVPASTKQNGRRQFITNLNCERINQEECIFYE